MPTDTQNWLEFINVAMLFPAFLATAVAAYFAYRTAQNERASFEAGFISDTRQIYYSDQMGQAIRQLVEFKTKYGASFREKYGNLRKSSAEGQPDNEFQRVDTARRTLKNHFETLAALRMNKLISETAFKILTKDAGILIYLDIVTPLGRALDSEYSEEYHRFLAQHTDRIRTSPSYVPPKSSFEKA